MIPNYDTFNARNLDPDQVAQTFVPSRDYYALWESDHTVVLGPRGSGKTTLFKMLTIPAIYTWQDSFAKSLRAERPFTAIYVPADMHWHHQLRSSDERLNASPAIRDAFSRAAVTTSVLTAVVKTFKSRLRYEVKTPDGNETEVARELIKQWRLPPTIPSFDMVALGLKARINDVRALLNRFSTIDPNDRDPRVLPEYFDLDYFAAMDVACAAFDGCFDLKQSRKWALCLDEMELAPDWLQSLSLSQVRSSDQSYLIKISTSPIPAVTGSTGAGPRQDYRLISIWNHTGRESSDFSQDLANAVLARRFGRPTSLEELLGDSPLLPNGLDGQTKYSRDSSEYQLFKNVASWDKSFAQILVEYGIEPTDPYTDDVTLRDRVLRKAKPIALFRSAFLKAADSGQIVFRSRKAAGLYCGASALIRVCDGNPRRLIGVLSDLASRVRISNDGSIFALDQNMQDEVMRRASSQFMGYISAIPEATQLVGEERLDIPSVLKAIANYFKHTILGNDFQLDPCGSFVVDSNSDGRLTELLRLAVYHGAVVHIDPLPDALETNVVGKRFRLSYMLAPIYRLPLTQYKEISLGRILRASGRLRIKKVIRLFEQQELNI